MFSVVSFFTIPVFAQNLPTSSTSASNLAAFADASRIYANPLSCALEEAFRQCFRTRVINGIVMNLRIPFAENHEREELSGTTWEVEGRGKAEPAKLWQLINTALDSPEFRQYAGFVDNGQEKVLIFDIPSQTWTYSTDIFDVARLKAGSYHGLPHKPYVLVSNRRIDETDVYNWLYCTQRLGIDCSGFVWHELSYACRKAGVNLAATMRRAMGARYSADTQYYAGTAFYDSKNKELLTVNDEIKNLRPGDIILFRADDGQAAHSAIIQSIDFDKGVIRYLQSTDESPLSQRGPHESFLYFDPKNTSVRLGDPSLRWTQKRLSPFEGETVSLFADDGERFRAYGGGKVVRLRLLSRLKF